MAGVNTLKYGYMWRVGKGQNINTWNDVWIPNCADRKVITLKEVNLLSKVADFIDPISNNWDEDLAKQTLWPVDAQRVLAISLPQHDTADFVAWSYTKNG